MFRAVYIHQWHSFCEAFASFCPIDGTFLVWTTVVLGTNCWWALASLFVITGFCILIRWLHFLRLEPCLTCIDVPSTRYRVDRKCWVKFAAPLSTKSLLSILVNYYHLIAFRICFFQKVTFAPKALKVMIFLVWGYLNNSIKAWNLK